MDNITNTRVTATSRNTIRLVNSNLTGAVSALAEPDRRDPVQPALRELERAQTTQGALLRLREALAALFWAVGEETGVKVLRFFGRGQA